MKRRQLIAIKPPANQGLGTCYLIYSTQLASEVFRMSSILVMFVIPGSEN